MSQNVKHLDHLNLSVRDFDETADFYRRVFGFDVVQEEVDSGGRRWGVLKGGDAMLCIYEHPDLEFADCADVRRRGLHAICHFGLRITDRKAWEETLQREQVDCSTMRWPHSTAWYVTDPTGWEIEVALWDEDQVCF